MTNHITILSLPAEYSRYHEHVRPKSLFDGQQLKTLLGMGIHTHQPRQRDKHGEKSEYRVFHVHHHATMNKERMKRAWYPYPHGNYFCYVFDEKAQLSSIIKFGAIISDEKKSREHIDGSPIFKTDDELTKYILS